VIRERNGHFQTQCLSERVSRWLLASVRLVGQVDCFRMRRYQSTIPRRPRSGSAKEGASTCGRLLRNCQVCKRSVTACLSLSEKEVIVEECEYGADLSL
jgi:hypothetical protein